MTTDGAAEFELMAANLNHAGRTAMPRAREAMKKALNGIASGAANRAPVATGALKNSMTTSTSGNRDYARGEVGPTVNYAAFVELGTSRQRAQPYLRPATDAVMPGYDAAIEQIAEDVL